MKYTNFRDFYPYYLSEHENQTCRRLHFIGSCLALLNVAAAIYFAQAWFIVSGLVCGYAFAWIGHFFFEHNKPATFQYPFYSFAGDWLMFWQILRGKISF